MNDNGPAKLKAFCTEALALLGTSVTDGDGVLTVSVPPSALDLFEGRPSLRLAFSADMVDDGAELVVPGSYVLERLIEAVRSRGELASEALDAVVQPSPAPGVGLANAEARLVSSSSALRSLLLATFRVSLVSDENQDRLVSVLVDTVTGQCSEIEPANMLGLAGRSCPANDVDAEALDKAFAAAEAAAMSNARQWASSAQREVDGRLAREVARLDQYYHEMLADTARGSKDASVRKAQRRRERATASYDDTLRVYAMAQEMLDKGDTLQSFSALFNHRWGELRKQKRRLQLSLGDGYSALAGCEREMKMLQKAFEIARRIFGSHSPETRLTELETERDGALAKLRQKAEVKEAGSSDPDALARIRDLDAQLDSEKARRIAELQDKFQIKVVVVPVSASIIRYPYAEHSYTAISGELSVPFTSRQDLITGKLEGPICQSCGGEMATGFACSCGRLACSACHKTCAGCGKDLCSRCVTGACQVCGGAVCEQCRSTCQSCGKLVCPTHSGACHACGKNVCKGGEGSCGKACAICGHDFCPDHIETCPVCSRPVCADDMRTCSECGVKACSDDIDECPCCGKPVCSNCDTTCALCGESVCRGCMDSSGWCATCRGLFPAASSGPAIEQILSLKGRRWLVNESRDAFVLIRKGIRRRVYVIDKATGQVASERVMGLFESLSNRLKLGA